MNILITAGPTREAVDPVRFIANRSSGKMGYAIATAAAERGHHARLISGPVCLSPPDGVAVTQAYSAADMLQCVQAYIAWCDVLVMAAAVSDWRPVKASVAKIKKGARRLILELEPTPDILSLVAPLKAGRLFIGFAAETSEIVAYAARKLEAKNLDYIVANDVSRSDAGFEVDTNCAVLLGAGGLREEWPLMPKQAMAGRLLDLIERHSARTP